MDAAWIRRATALLHASTCQSLWWSTECRRRDGGDHALRTARPVVLAALESDDPAQHLHDRYCAAFLDSTFGACPDRTRHIALFRKKFGLEVAS